MVREYFLIANLLLILLPEFALADRESCGALSLGSEGQLISGLQKKCDLFQDKWVSELRLQRNPKQLSKDLASHADMVSANLQNARCIESLTNKEFTLTEIELQELKKRNLANIANALHVGQERSRLFREIRDTYQKLSNAIAHPDKRNPDRSRPSIYKACTDLLEERLKLILKMDGELKETQPREYQGPDRDVS